MNSETFGFLTFSGSIGSRSGVVFFVNFEHILHLVLELLLLTLNM